MPNASGYTNGDFNYDGVISGDDYSVIDFNMVAHGAPRPAGGAASTVSGTGVPEAAGCAVALSLAGYPLVRRRRRPSR